LKRDLSSEDIEAFENDLNALQEVETVKTAYIGNPAPTDRPIIDRTYDYALILEFENKADHDVYQTHPIHDTFVENNGKHFLKVQIYDAV
jgi:hypothetical protein